MKKNIHNSKLKMVIMAAALSISMMTALTACGSASTTESSAVTESSDVAVQTTESSTAASTESASAAAVEDGTYMGVITAVSDTSVTISTMGAGAQGQGGAPAGQPGGNTDSTEAAGGTDAASGDKPSGDKPSGDKPSGDKPSGDKPSGEAPDATASTDESSSDTGKSAPSDGNMSAPADAQKMTFTVTADQIADFAEGDMVTIVVENGTVSSITKADKPDDNGKTSDTAASATESTTAK